MCKLIIDACMYINALRSRILDYCEHIFSFYVWAMLIMFASVVSDLGHLICIIYDVL